MEIIDYNSIETQGFLNIKEVLDANTDIKVTSSFSKNSDIPIIVLSIQKTPVSTKFNNKHIAEVQVNVRCLNKTKLSADLLTKSITDIIYNNIDELSAYGLQYKEYRSLPIDFERGNQRIHGTDLVYIFWYK